MQYKIYAICDTTKPQNRTFLHWTNGSKLLSSDYMAELGFGRGLSRLCTARK